MFRFVWMIWSLGGCCWFLAELCFGVYVVILLDGCCLCYG